MKVLSKGTLLLNIAGIVIKIDNLIGYSYELPFFYENFLCKESKNEVDIRVCFLKRDVLPEIKIKCSLFCRQNSPWRLYSGEVESKEALVLKTYKKNEERFIAILEGNFKKADIYVDITEKLNPWPFSYPLGELIVMGFLKTSGLTLHSAAIDKDEDGILFVGTSGAGKSTIAKLLKESGFINEKDILTDEKVIVKTVNGAYYIYGTPWPGSEKFSQNKKSPLKSIYFLNHSRRNRIDKISPNQAVKKLFCSSFMPFWSRQTVEKTLKFANEMVNKIECFELEFSLSLEIGNFLKEQRYKNAGDKTIS